MKVLLFLLLVASSAYGEGPAIIFDAQRRPASGIPPEAWAQGRTNALGAAWHHSTRQQGPAKKLHKALRRGRENLN